MVQKTQSYWYEYLLLITLSLCINGIFLYSTFKTGEYCFGTLLEHGEVGYNVARYNSCKINPERVQCVAQKQHDLGRYVDYCEIDHHMFSEPTMQRDVGDTIGYGCILGLLWKVTKSYKYLDVQLLQILIFSLLMLLVFQSALLLFGNRTCALVCSIALLCFFPLIFQNVQAHRDVWAYYGTIILVYSVLSFLREQRAWYWFVLGSCAFAAIQWVRPSVFFALITLSAALMLYGLVQGFVEKKLLLAVLIVWGTNIVGFWIPFFAFNQQAYGRFFVGPVGQDLLEGIGEYENPWGYQLDDGWYHRFMKEQYPELKTREERDDQAKKLFNQAVQERPLFFITSFFKRFIAQLVPNLPWSHYPEYLYQGCFSLKDKIMLALKSPRVCIDLVARMLYIRIFLLLGYLGAALLVWRRRYFQVFLLAGIIIGGLGKFISHIEYRYIVPFYWPFAFFIGYLVYLGLFRRRH